MFTTRPELAGTFGMVASTHWLASATGMAVLESGGNAFDAATAAGFVLQVWGLNWTTPALRPNSLRWKGPRSSLATAGIRRRCAQCFERRRAQELLTVAPVHFGCSSPCL